jgi:hypothetical protein
MGHALLHLRDGHTIRAAVQGGHVNVVAWLADDFGLHLDDTVIAATWMAGMPGLS